MPASLDLNTADNRSSVEGRARLTVRQPQCLTWCPRTGALWVGTTDGVVLIDRFLGRHVVAMDDVPATLALSGDGETGLVVGQGGRLSVLQRASARVVPHARTGLHGRFHAFVSRGRFFVAGIGARGGRLFEVLRTGARRIARLPDGAACGPGRGGPRIVRIIEGQPVSTTPDDPGERASDPGHALLVRRRTVLSWTHSALCVRGRGDPVSVLVSGVSACDLDPGGTRLAVGTLDGRVGVVHLEREAHRLSPRLQRLSRSPVRAVHFSPEGGHLATLSDHLDIWDMGGGDW